jgi:uncharacterized membrane protein
MIPVWINGWTLVLLLHVATTMFMVGLIWLVQIVHYPLFAQVGDKTFWAYHRRHSQLITFIVAPLMLLELATGLLLWFRAPFHPFWILNTLGLAILWGSTALWQVPLHKQLTVADGTARLALIHHLVASNWLRTIVWSLRGAFLIGWLLKLLN